MHNLEVLIESGKRLIVLETSNEADVLRAMKELSRHSRRLFYTWSATKGLAQIPADFDVKPLSTKIEVLFSEVSQSSLPAVFILIDFHPYIEEPLNIRRIKDVLHSNSNAALVLVSKELSLPEELQAYAVNFVSELPSRDEIQAIVKHYAKEWHAETQQKVKSESENILQRLVDNLSGISKADVERLARNAIFDDGIINKQDIIEVTREKFALLNQDSILHLHLDYESMAKVAGMQYLKRWLELREPVFTGEVSLPGEDVPKGMLLLGVQGCGKSLAAKATAAAWHMPLMHLDMGALYNRFYGQTEQNLRDALDTAQAMAPCILWIDEIEKGLSAVSASDDVSKRMLGTFLTWLAEKKARVFVVATANDVSALPPELMRKGRFDEIFFVDLPTQADRAQILSIHLTKRNIELTESAITELAQQTDGFSGAELEQLIVSAMYASYAQKTTINQTHIDTEINNTQPLSVIMAEEVQALRSWASTRTVRA